MTQDNVPGFGERIKEIREQKGLTLIEAGELIGVGASQLSSYENNKHNVSSLTLLAIARAYGVSADFLLGLGESTGGGTTEKKDETAYAKVIFALNKLEPHLFNDAIKNLSAYIKMLESGQTSLPPREAVIPVKAPVKTESPVVAEKKPSVTDIFQD